MGFHFRLETVLKHRRRVMEDRAAEVSILERKLDRARRVSTEIEESLQEFREQTPATPGSRLHVGDLMAKTAWLTRMSDRLRVSESTIDTLRTKRDGLRSDLEDAWRQCEVLEKLKTRQAAEYRRKTGRRATVEMDEIGSVRHAFRTPA